MVADVYLDAASATPLLPEARDAIVAALDRFGDPLAIHAPGRAARTQLDDARAQVAGAIGAQPDEIVFTSGGTESIALALWGGARAIRDRGSRIVVGAVEHPAVGAAADALAADGFVVVIVPADGDGRVDLERFAAELAVPGTALASIQHANHELGTLQPIAEAARLAGEARVRFHTDACQTVGRLPVDATTLGVDLLSLSAHKFGGPPGIGALYVRRGVRIAAHLPGDDRERKRRSGMENTPGIAGMAAALISSVGAIADRAAAHWSLTAHLRDRLASEVPDVTVHGHPTQRVPHLVGFSVAGIDPATLMMSLDDRGFAVGAGSLCSGRPEDPSPVLDAIGHPTTVGFRVGLGPEASERELDRLVDVLSETVRALRRVESASSAAMARLRSAGPSVG